ncbi:hypothetical protein TRAPUB_344 [Trametes pubescens]|uniref:Uncharacterized protein n=1 Tax=Trametes pubescens TaxID=154538 RepID=A0A1M2VMA9_TRAPU|nr:hypothetical protein TRAPUB_344 [Trametes pubescens]
MQLYDMRIVSFALNIMASAAGYKLKEFTASRLPPRRLHEIKDALAEIHGLLRMFEHKGRLFETDEAQKYGG